MTAASTDAVNGSQLFATNQQVASNTTAITALDGRVTTNTTAITNLDGRVTDLDGRVTSNTTAIANLDGRVTNLDGRVTANTTAITALDGRVTDNTTAITALDGRVTNNTTAITNLDGRVAGNTTAITNLDGRVTSNTTAITNIQAQVANVPVRYASDANPATPSATPTNTVQFVGATPAPVKVSNVAAGTLAAGSTEAVNGAQLAATNSAVAGVRADTDRNTADILAISINLPGSTVAPVMYSNPETPTVGNGGVRTNHTTLVGANSAAPVALHNVANGILANDAVNVGQLNSGLGAALANAYSYTDAKFAEVGFDLKELRRDAFAGTAGVLAVAGLPQPIEIGKSMIAGAIGHYRGETAFAIGLSKHFAEGGGIFKAGGSVDTHGYAGLSAGAGWSF